MRLNEELLEKVEEFFDLIPTIDLEKLDFSMDSLRHFLERDVDGWTEHSHEELTEAVAERLVEVWDLIPEEERNNSDLIEAYNELSKMLSEDGTDVEAEIFTDEDLDPEGEESWN